MTTLIRETYWLSAALALVPLAFFPGVFLHYDITPKLVAMCLVAAGLIFFTGGASRTLAASSGGRPLLLLIAWQAASLALSTIFSTSPAGSVSGSTWRRFGLPVQIALLVFLLIAIATLARNTHARRAILRTAAVTSILTSVYGIVQYFELDPFIQRQLYSAGQYNQPILRPPSTLGSGSNFGIFSLAAVFLALSLWREEKTSVWRSIAGAAAGLGMVAVVLSGTRAALLGLIAGLGFIAIRRTRAVTRSMLLAGAAVVAAMALFYWSPPGRYLRNRVVQAWGDWKGGTRPWLWRDSARMFLRRPGIGYGLDTFTGTFPRFQSAGLARAFPDSYSESPHNFLLDVLVSQGALGLAPWAGLLFAAFWRARAFEPAIFGGLLALFVAQFFFSFEIGTALYFYFFAALALAEIVGPVKSPPGASSNFVRVGQVCGAALLAAFALEIAVADRWFEKARQDLASGKLTESVRDYDSGIRWFPLGFNSSLWYSRTLLAAAQSRNQVPAMSAAISKTALDAYATAEDRHNACYHLAMWYASQGQVGRSVALIQDCITLAPSWYVPYWAAALLYQSIGDRVRAERMALSAIDYSGRHRPEMVAALAPIRGAHLGSK
jgi:O-antigen ligase